MIRRYGVTIFIFIIICGLILLNPGKVAVPAEKTDVLAGIGSDLTKDNKHRITISVYTFNKKDEVSSEILSATGNTINETREKRQLKDNRRFLSALEKVIICGENLAIEHGIKDDVDMTFANSFMNDMGWAVVCKGEAKEIMSKPIDGYPSSSDYINGLVESSREYNYFSDNYKLMDIYVRIEQEGRSLVLPYIELSEGKPKISGLALFKKYKMIGVTNIQNARLLNILREKKGKGNLDYIIDSNLFTSSYGDVKRKVTCEKMNSQYAFNIDLNFTEDIVSSTLYKDMESKPEELKEYEELIGKQIKKQCEDFIRKMQNEYKVDCLELGKVACAKYGRGKGIDWDDVVSNAKINVNVKVKIRSLGRGRYVK